MKLFILTAALISTLAVSAQIQDFSAAQVYPYRAEINLRKEIVYFISADDEKIIDVLTDYYFPVIVGDERYFHYDETKELTDTDKRNARKTAVYEAVKKMQAKRNEANFIRNSQISFKKLSKIFRANSGIFYEDDEAATILPYLDSLPDGKYVQYFKPFISFDNEGRAIIINDAPAATFHMTGNKLNGEAHFYTPAGILGMSGQYRDGFRQGQFIEKFPGMYLLSISKQFYKSIKKNDLKIKDFYDSTVFSYNEGLLDGAFFKYRNGRKPAISEGFYKNGEPAGQWITRQGTYFSDSLQVTSRFTFADSLIRVFQPVILDDYISSNSYQEIEGFNFPKDKSVSINLSSMYILAENEKENWELEEEKISSYQETEYDEYGDYGFEGMYLDETFITEEQKLMDSLGIKWRFDGLFELYDYTGHILYRTNFINGYKAESDTIFFPGKKPFCVISKHDTLYHKTIYDYDGKVFSIEQFNSKGHYDSVLVSPFGSQENLVYDGLEYELDSYSKAWVYYNPKAFEDSVTSEDYVLNRYRNVADSAIQYERVYYPEERRLIYKNYGIKGTVIDDNELIFGENFEYWNGKSNYRFDNYRLEKTQSASFSKNPYRSDDTDTNLLKRVLYPYDLYDYNMSGLLYKDEMPFSGKIEIDYDTRKYAFRETNESVSVQLPISNKYNSSLKKDLEKYEKKGKIGKKSPAQWMDRRTIEENYYHYVITGLLAPDAYSFVSLPYTNNEEEEYYEMSLPESLTLHKLKGQFTEGKPSGTWYALDKKGLPMAEYNYLKGELEGEAKIYQLQQSKKDVYSLYLDFVADLPDTLPEKSTRYLSEKKQYKNGRPHGIHESYDWTGKVTSRTTYLNGYMDGPSLKKSSLVRFEMNFKDDQLDGIVKAWFFKSPQDSIQLYDLNFQNGLLQGESRSYHPNGKLAKRGFFLTGQPIDDYEAFDSLGFKYQYVKFQFNQPVEEKVWELSELSVKYEFDWRDSLEFNPSDITDIQSLNTLFYEMGYVGEEIYAQPYVGRVRLINKARTNYKLTKYYPNNTVARTGRISDSKKTGCWKHYDYDGNFMYEVDYFDTLIELNDSVKFLSKGIYNTYDDNWNVTSSSYVIEKSEKYDCSHSDHYEIRQFYTIYQQENDTVDRMNGTVKNFYDNGVIQSEGKMLNGLPDGVWKYYDAFGNLNKVGTYVLGKRDGRWLSGDLSKTRFLGEICLNPNMPNLEEEIAYREKQLNIVITNYKMGLSKNKEMYDVDLNTIVTD